MKTLELASRKPALRLGWGESLNVQGTTSLLIRAAQEVIAAEELLNLADRALGGGSFGSDLRQGCDLACHTLQGQSFVSPGAVFIAVGQALLIAASEHDRQLFGAIWVAGGKRIMHATQLNATLFAAILDEGMATVQKFGKFKLGDKTLLDALAPASRAARFQNRTLGACLHAASLAACEGAQKTRDYFPGKPRTATEPGSAIGHADPSAIAFSIWLKGMAQEMSKENDSIL
jgi:phosphoenolpyruvate---glycerone phosphotransferase subunit DhaL